jgi:hypothetical protein
MEGGKRRGWSVERREGWSGGACKTGRVDAEWKYGGRKNERGGRRKMEGRKNGEGDRPKMEGRKNGEGDRPKMEGRKNGEGDRPKMEGREA